MKTSNINNRRSFLLPAIFFCTIFIFNYSCKKTPPQANSKPIIYTDVDPDSIILSKSNTTYHLDLNNDGTADFIFSETGLPVNNCRSKDGISYIADVRPAGNDARPAGTNNAIIYDGSIPRVLDSLAVIDSNATWTVDTINKMLYVNTIGEAATCNPPSGPWNFSGNHFLGLKIIKAGNSYYGWARIYKSDETSMILTGYAFNSNPNKSILAGQTK